VKATLPNFWIHDDITKRWIVGAGKYKSGIPIRSFETLAEADYFRTCLVNEIRKSIEEDEKSNDPK
jgi:hypothetical protein